MEGGVGGCGNGVYFRTGVEKWTNHPDALGRYCTTLPREFATEAVWKDTEGRLYVPRVGLTEDTNGSVTDINKSERWVWFDCYTKRLSQTDVKKGVVKTGPPRLGDKIDFKTHRGGPKDLGGFEAVVEDVYWNQYYRTSTVEGVPDEEKEFDSVGVVMVKVGEDYGRSLVVGPLARIKRFTLPKAL